MLNFIAENLASLVVGAMVFAAVGAVVLYMIRNVKNRRSFCGGGCAGCPGAGKCGGAR